MLLLSSVEVGDICSSNGSRIALLRSALLSELLLKCCFRVRHSGVACCSARRSNVPRLLLLVVAASAQSSDVEESLTLLKELSSLLVQRNRLLVEGRVLGGRLLVRDLLFVVGCCCARSFVDMSATEDFCLLPLFVARVVHNVFALVLSGCCCSWLFDCCWWKVVKIAFPGGSTVAESSLQFDDELLQLHVSRHLLVGDIAAEHVSDVSPFFLQSSFFLESCDESLLELLVGVLLICIRRLPPLVFLLFRWHVYCSRECAFHILLRANELFLCFIFLQGVEPNCVVVLSRVCYIFFFWHIRRYISAVMRQPSLRHCPTAERPSGPLRNLQPTSTYLVGHCE